MNTIYSEADSVNESVPLRPTTTGKIGIERKLSDLTDSDFDRFNMARRFSSEKALLGWMHSKHGSEGDPEIEKL